MIGLLGISLVWGILGFIYVALNEHELELKSKFIKYVIKTVVCGPLFIIFCYIRWKCKRKK